MDAELKGNVEKGNGEKGNGENGNGHSGENGTDTRAVIAGQTAGSASSSRKKKKSKKETGHKQQQKDKRKAKEKAAEIKKGEKGNGEKGNGEKGTVDGNGQDRGCKCSSCHYAAEYPSGHCVYCVGIAQALDYIAFAELHSVVPAGAPSWCTCPCRGCDASDGGWSSSSSS
jgi:hypothetical protein